MVNHQEMTNILSFILGVVLIGYSVHQVVEHFQKAASLVKTKEEVDRIALKTLGWVVLLFLSSAWITSLIITITGI